MWEKLQVCTHKCTPRISSSLVPVLSQTFYTAIDTTSVEIQEWVKPIFPVLFFIPISATIRHGSSDLLNGAHARSNLE